MIDLRSVAVETSLFLWLQRLNQAKRLLDRLRACIIASYYGRVMCGNSHQVTVFQQHTI